MRTLLILILTATAAHAQTLYRQNSGTSETLYTISMMDDSNGIAAGSRQSVAVTTNAGVRWTASQVFGLENYYCSYYNDTSSGAIGGTHGFLLCKRPRHGFAQIVLPERKDIHDITFPTSDDFGNPRDLLCVGDTGLIYKSGDSGKNWAKVTPPALVANRNFYGATYWYDSTWWIVGAGGVILYTEDAGTTWQRIPSGTQKDLYSIEFPSDGTTGWIAGDQTLLYTTDGGDTWVSIPTIASLRAIVGYGDTGISMHDTGYAVGLNGVLLTTTDLIHWAPVETGTTANLYGLSLTDNLYVVGDSGVIFTSMVPQNNSVNPCTESNRNFGVTCDGSQLSLISPIAEPIDIHIYDLLGIEQAEVHVIGQSSTLRQPLPNGAYLYRTSIGMSGKFIIR